MPVVNIPNVGRVTFPDSMSQDDITTAIERDILKREQSDQIVRRPESGGAAGAVGPVMGAGPTLGQGALSALEVGQVPSKMSAPMSAQEQELDKRLETPLMNLPQSAYTPPVTALISPQLARESARVVKENVEGMTSPANLAALPYAALGGGEAYALKAAGIKGIGPATRIVGGAFGLQGAQGLKESVPQYIDAVEKGDQEGAMKAWAQMAQSSAMVLAGAHAINAKAAVIPPDQPPVILKETLLPRSAEAVKQIERTPDASSQPKTTTEDGNLRTQPERVMGQMPVEEGGSGVQPQAEGRLPETPSGTLTPAILVQGKTFTGEDHLAAYEKAKTSGQPDTSGAQEGFVNDKGDFLTREQAAQQTGLPTETEPGKLHSSDLESKPPPSSSETVPQIEAPAEPSAVSEASKPGESPPGEAPAISQATTEGQKAQPVAQKRGPVQRPWDIIDEIESSVGKIRNKKNARPGSEGYYGDAYANASRGAGRGLFAKEGQSPDAALDALRRSGMLPEGATVDDLWTAIERASGQRRAIFKGETPEIQADKFQAALEKQGQVKGSHFVSVGDLAVGDKFRVGTEELEVTSIDPDTGEVTVKDGRKFGVQTIPDGADVPIAKGSLQAGPQTAAFTKEDFALNAPESVDQQKARLAHEEEVQKRKAEREKIEAAAAKPLVGSRGDIGQGDLLGGGDLFSGPKSDVLGIVPRGTAKGVALVRDVGKRLYNLREEFRQLWEAQPNRRLMEQTLDGAETLAGTEGRQVRRSLELDGSLLDRQAAYAIVEANDTYAKLGQFLTQVRGKNLDATRAVRHAMANYAKLKPLADKVRTILDAQIDMEKQVGLDPEYREAYVPHILDLDLLMGTKRPVVLSGGRGGLSTAFKKGRTFDTIFDAIEAGYNPKSIDVAKVVEHRVRAGQQMINRKMWADSLRTAVDPIDNRPIVTDLEHKSRGPGKPGWEQAPMGYVPKEILPGIRLAVHEGYARYWDALTGQSTLAQSLPGKIALHTEGTIKHGLLLFDTFHASRIAQKELFLTRGNAGYRKGLALLEYGDSDLAKAVAAGDITPEMARYARANRPTADLLMKSGLNVGKIQEALYSGFVRKWPVIGTFNKWVFEKLTRGAMLESGIIEFDRLKQANPTWTDAQTAQYAARRLNQLFGNLGRQGMFKSAGARDAARLFFLAPQWVESMARTELGGLRELTIDPIAKRQSIIAGTLARSVGQGLAAYLVGTQLLNLATRGNLTWDNPEKGHKLDAWIPDITGRTNGFFISPLSVVAELSHDIVRYLHSEGSLLKAGSRILSNKFSPFLRAEEVLRTGETPTREKIPDDWTRLLYAGFALAPTPIPASPLIHSDYPGQIQRQLTASAGFKTEPAPTYVQRMSQLAQDFAKSQGRDKPIEMMHVLGTGYGDLRAALRRGDDTTARQQLEKLRGAHTDQEIRRAFELYVSRPFTGTLKMESKFKASLTPEERAAYDSAKDEKRLMLSRLKGLLRE